MSPDTSQPSRRTGGSPSRRQLLQTLAVVGVGCLAGCSAIEDDSPFTPIESSADTWPRAGFDPKNTAQNPGAEGPRNDPTTAWTADIDLIVESVVVGESTVFVSGHGRLAALERATGDVRWQIQAISNVLHVGDGVLYVGGNSMVQAIDPATGEDVWEQDDRHMNTASLLRVERGLLVGGYGEVRLHHPDTGELEWRTDIEGSYRTELTAANGMVFATHGGQFLKFQPRRFPGTRFHDGPEQAWARKSEAPQLLGVTLTSNTAFLGEYAIGLDPDPVPLESIALDSGQSQVHPIEAARVSPPTVVTDHLVLATNSSERESRVTGAILGYDPVSGTVLWRYDVDGVPTRPISDGRTVYAGGHGGPQGDGPTSVVALDAADGDRLWKRDFDHETSALAVVGDTLFVGTGNGEVTALRAE